MLFAFGYTENPSHNSQRGELRTRQPSGNVAANNKSGINRCSPPTYRSERPGRGFPGGQRPARAGRACPPSGPAAGPGDPRPAADPGPRRPDSFTAT